MHIFGCCKDRRFPPLCPICLGKILKDQVGTKHLGSRFLHVAGLEKKNKIKITKIVAAVIRSYINIISQCSISGLGE